MKILKDIVWNRQSYKELVEYLISLSDLEYKKFNLRIISSKYEMLGIRIPILRKLAKEISKTDFIPLLELLYDKYFEIVMLEGLLISYIDDFEDFQNKLVKYALKVDNWAICDTVASSLKIINKNKDKSLNLVDTLIRDKHEYSKRFGFVILLDFYVEKEYLSDIFNYINSCKVDDYYVNMAISWLLCECYVKFTNETFKYIKEANLNDFIIRKTISKVNDSYRVSKEDKERLRELKAKK